MFLPLVWTGIGWLVPASVSLSTLIAQLITRGLTGLPDYWDYHRWPAGAALFAAGAVCAHYAKLLNPNEIDRLLKKIEDQKKRTFYLVRLKPSDARERHSFFWVPLKFWFVILGFMTAYYFSIDLGWVSDN